MDWPNPLAHGVWVLVTQVLKADPSCQCISDLLDTFLEAFRSKYSASAAAAAVSRTDLRVSVGGAGRPLPHTTPTSVLQPGCDLFIRCSAKPTSSNPGASTALPSQTALDTTQPPAPCTPAAPVPETQPSASTLPDAAQQQLSNGFTRHQAAAPSATNADQHKNQHGAHRGAQGTSAKQPAGPIGVAGDVLDGPQLVLVVRALWARAAQAQQLQSYKAASDMLRQVRGPSVGGLHVCALPDSVLLPQPWHARSLVLSTVGRRSMGDVGLDVMAVWVSRWPWVLQHPGKSTRTRDPKCSAHTVHPCPSTHQTLDLIPEAPRPPTSAPSSGPPPAGSPTALRVATLRRLARLWLAAGNAREAAAWALEAARLRPEDPGVLELAGDCLRWGRGNRGAAK